ncbi:MAG TPA: DUF4159 domain-containing protein [Tepidisphaeraceae bacterium]|jgi:hypothetical protein|nr:DUF4159 domain-containing protein [Tepidisphaeraceae bacterium]
MSDTQRCPNCSKRLPPAKTLKFCPFCGSKLNFSKSSKANAADEPVLLDDFPELIEAPVAPLPPTRQQSLDPRLIKLGILGVLLLAVVVAGAYFITLMTGGDNSLATATPPPAARPVAPPPLLESPAATVEPAPAPLPPPQPAPVPVNLVTPAYAKLMPQPAVMDPKAVAVTGSAIDASMRRGVGFLLSQYKGYQLAEVQNEAWREGMHCLAAQALVYASYMMDDPRLSLQGDFMRGVLDYLKTFEFEGNYEVYGRSLRLSALSLARRPQDRPIMTADTQWLLKATASGAFTYTAAPEGRHPDGMDNSNGQYGVLGLGAAVEAGLIVPGQFWIDVHKLWLERQNEDGGWGYYANDKQSTSSMTAAGVTSLLLAAQPGAQTGVGRDLVAGDAAVQRGIAWLAKGDNLTELGPHRHPGYTLYGIERAGLASGYRYFGDKDWYLTLLPKALATQQENGSWIGEATPIGETAFHLLFMSRGSLPILMSKLQYEGKWDARPRDVSHLTRYAGTNLERGFNWQIVPFTQPWQNWTGSPVVFMSGNAPPNIDEKGIENIRGFIEHGGLLFSNADGDGAAFTAWIEALAARLYPHYPMQDVPENHPIYRVAAIIKNKQPLRYVTNGSRILMLHSPTDVAKFWHPVNERNNPDAFGLGVNVAVFATARTPFRDRLQQIFVSDDEQVTAEFPIVRIPNDANWNAEPTAWDNYGRWLKGEASIGIAATPVEPTKLDPFEQPIAHLTGTTAYVPSKDHLDAMRSYVSAGGILLVDATGGAEDVAESMLKVVNDLTEGAEMQPLTPKHPLISPSGDWADVGEATVWPTVGGRPDGVDLSPRVANVGEGFVIYFDRDLTTGLMGGNAWNMRGYTTNWGRQMMKNLIIAAIERGKTRTKEVPASGPAAAPSPNP